MSASNLAITYKRIFENPFSRKILQFLIKKHPKHKKSYLELGLEALAGELEHSDPLISISKHLVSLAINIVAHTFKANKKEILEGIDKPYNRRGIYAVVKGVVDFGVRKPFVPGAPFLVVWDYTYRCNLRCKHCYINAGIDERPEMTLDERRRALDIMADAGVVSIAFSGGEPLLGPGIFDMIKRAHDYGMYTAIATNGTLITEKIAEKLKRAGLDYAQISLDAPYPEIHDDFRGIPGAWARTVRGIKNAKKAGIMVEISTTITRYNIDYIDEMIRLAEELGVDMFMHFNFVPTGRGKEIIEMDLTPIEREKLLRKFVKILYSNPKVPTLSTAPQLARVAIQYANSCKMEEYIVGGHFYGFEMGEKAKEVAEFLGGCGAGRLYISLEPNGDIQPCVFLPIKVGNILRDGFMELWRNNKVFNELRNRDLYKGFCGQCPYRYVCGGCRARAYAYFGDYLAPDVGCIYNRKLWESITRKMSEVGESEKLLKIHA